MWKIFVVHDTHGKIFDWSFKINRICQRGREGIFLQRLEYRESFAYFTSKREAERQLIMAKDFMATAPKNSDLYILQEPYPGTVIIGQRSS